jgi:hypothetical protein
MSEQQEDPGQPLFARLGFGGRLSFCLENRWVVGQETWAAPFGSKSRLPVYRLLRLRE